MKQEGELEDLLPLHSLRNVKELELQHPYERQWRYGTPVQQAWPMAWSQLTALTSLSCMLSHEHVAYDGYPPPVLKRLTSLVKIAIVHTNPDIDPDMPLVDEEYEGDADLARQGFIHGRIYEHTRGLTRLTSLLIDEKECIGLRSAYLR